MRLCYALCCFEDSKLYVCVIVKCSRPRLTCFALEKREYDFRFFHPWKSDGVVRLNTDLDRPGRIASLPAASLSYIYSKTSLPTDICASPAPHFYLNSSGELVTCCDCDLTPTVHLSTRYNSRMYRLTAATRSGLYMSEVRSEGGTQSLSSKFSLLCTKSVVRTHRCCSLRSCPSTELAHIVTVPRCS